MLFADLSLFGSILKNSSGRRRFIPNYGRDRNGRAKRAGDWWQSNNYREGLPDQGDQH